MNGGKLRETTQVILRWINESFTLTDKEILIDGNIHHIFLLRFLIVVAPGKGH